MEIENINLEKTNDGLDRLSIYERLNLYECAINGGDADALMKCCFLAGSINEEQYKDFIEIGKECSESDDES